MNPPAGLYQAIPTSCFGLREDEGGRVGWFKCVSLYQMRHSALALFARINVITDCGCSFRKTRLLRIFYILHKSATTQSNGTCATEVLSRDSQRGRLSNEKKTASEGGSYGCWQGATPLVQQNTEGINVPDLQCQHYKEDKLDQFEVHVSIVLPS